MRLVRARRQRRLDGAPLRLHVGLADLLRAILLLSIALALGTFLARRSGETFRLSLAMESMVQAVTTLIVLAIVCARIKWYIRLILVKPLAVAVVAASFVELYELALASSDWLYISIPPHPIQTILRNSLVAACQLFVFIAVRKANSQSHLQSSREVLVLRYASRLTLGLSGVFTAILLSYLWWKMTFLPPLPENVAVYPNGFDAMFKASQLVAPGNAPDPATVSTSELQRFVERNKEAIAASREAIKLPWYRPLDLDQDFDFSALRNVWHAINGSIYLAAREERWDDVVRDAVLNLRLASRVRNGGLQIDYMVGTSLEQGTIPALEPVLNRLDAEQCERLLTALREIESNRRSEDEIAAIDRVWWLHKGGYQNSLIDAMGSDRERSALTNWQSRHTQVLDALAGLVRVELEIWRFLRLHGRLPEGLGELAGKSFNALPEDPFTKSPFIYRRTAADRFVLYSVGPDRDDDGGKSMSWQAALMERARRSSDGDFFLDYWDEMTPGSKPVNAAPGMFDSNP